MIQRIFIPGSNWIYFKLYTGEKTADVILVKVIEPIIKKLQKSLYIKKWFFIRYSDPDFHLRIRLLINDTKNLGEIISLFSHKLQIYVNNHLIWKVQLDTYNRELERYNCDLIEETESLFFFDSECILEILKKMKGNENYRWMISLKLIDELLSNFYFTIEEKQSIMEEITQSFKLEFGLNELYIKQFSRIHRKNKMIIESVLNNTLDEEKFVILYSSIKKRTMRLQSVIMLINSKKNKEKIIFLTKSYLHMMIDRIFPINNRIHEMIISDFMSRYYTSEIVKNKHNKQF